MPLFGRRKFSVAGLLTGVISAQAGAWDVFWVGDGETQPPESGFVAPGLTEAAEQATNMALAWYATGPQVPGAELQLAIYPCEYGRDAPIYDISGGPGDFHGRDLLGRGGRVIAASLEDLVSEVGMQRGGAVAMLIWGRPFADLTADAPDQ